MADESLIDQALAIIAAAGPRPAGFPVTTEGMPDLTPEQHIVEAIYEARRTQLRGWPGSDANVKSGIRVAKSAKIPQGEIDAAIAAAERDKSEG